MALVEIASGDVVVKYGSAIGIATADIAAGAHVHTHNVASERGRGDTSA
jgi:predicted RecA/RadA family phage recombinase